VKLHSERVPAMDAVVTYLAPCASEKQGLYATSRIQPVPRTYSMSMQVTRLNHQLLKLRLHRESVELLIKHVCKSKPDHIKLSFQNLSPLSPSHAHGVYPSCHSKYSSLFVNRKSLSLIPATSYRPARDALEFNHVAYPLHTTLIVSTRSKSSPS
jgi:hypothetical protein